jgi:ubiquinone/menaquinone biosynthesis C-methylase UbiE
VRGIEQIPWLYDAMLWVGEAAGLRSWREKLAAGARGRVLDVGCGTGRNLPLFPAGTKVIGLDPARDSLRRARRRAPGVALVRASAEALPFRDGAFDTVVSGLVFCSVPDPLRGLAEVKRVLAPGGRLGMLEHVRSTSRLGARWQDFIQPWWTWVSGGCHPNRDTEANVRAAGFEIDPADHRARKGMRRFSAWPPGT